MKLRIYDENNQKTSNWSGGTTRELAIFPEGASYLDRDFVWRLSTASSDKEESSFSRLEGFDRILMVLEGDVVLAHGGDRTAHLGQFQQDSFDGGIKTRCFGKLEKDYNLIMARGCQGSIEVIEVENEARRITQDHGEFAGGQERYCSCGIYCIDGYAVISGGERSEMVKAGSQAVVDFAPGEKPEISVMGEGRCVIAKVSFAPGEDHEKATADEVGSYGGSFFSEYGTCMKLFARSNRWSKMLRREGVDNVYYDRPLSEALSRLERRYITSIVWAAGCILCFLPLLITDRIGICVLGALVFTCVHLLLIAPLIYWVRLPKPLSAHMKGVDELNAMERVQHERDIAEDPHFDRLMSKYSSDDESYFTDEKSVLYRLVKKK